MKTFKVFDDAFSLVYTYEAKDKGDAQEQHIAVCERNALVTGNLKIIEVPSHLLKQAE